MYDLLGYAWAEDKEHCEEFGRMLNADPSKVSLRAKKRGIPQVTFLFYMMNAIVVLGLPLSHFFTISWALLEPAIIMRKSK